ncbi:hypothetical protein KIN20_020063 [Parelaphostrongylus tenuis]|uniref:Uncharacterized protein n=1 Tax=Parelaphostrongylus tenuis TaxID=148309 RepID=A0AAD5N3P7_PARTN|nr:hypothetical protein KIN20_020063 [Parelaphostrongylus tenuis]
MGDQDDELERLGIDLDCPVLDPEEATLMAVSCDTSNDVWLNRMYGVSLNGLLTMRASTLILHSQPNGHDPASWLEVGPRWMACKARLELHEVLSRSNLTPLSKLRKRFHLFRG